MAKSAHIRNPARAESPPQQEINPSNFYAIMAIKTHWASDL